jgi:hypothetical protein
MERMPTFTDPNVGVYDGEDRIMHVPFAAGTIFRRRGGKAVDLHHRYRAATANSSNLAGFAEVEEVGVAGGRPTSVADGDTLPVNFSLHKSQVFPTTGRAANQADRGKDFDIFVDATGRQFVNMGASVMGVLRISRIVTADGLHVSCEIPPDLRYGNE